MHCVLYLISYDACMDVTDSDHKPVRCLINVDIARSDKSVKRQNLGEILMSNIQIRSFILEICTVPEITVSSNSTVLQNMDTTVICITNRCKKNKAIIEISCEGQSSINKEDGSISEPHRRGGSGFPRWLEVNLYFPFYFRSLSILSMNFFITRGIIYNVCLLFHMTTY